MSDSDRSTDASTPRLLVKAATEVEERVARGDLRARAIFTEHTAPFESSFTFVLYNRVPAGGQNERHVRDDVEKVYYFVKGSGEVKCDPWSSRVQAGDFLFFPAAIAHEIRCDEGEDLEFVVCAARTLEPPAELPT